MKNHSQVDNFEQHLESEDGRERIIEVVEELVARTVLIDGIFRGERYRTTAYHRHDQCVEVAQCHDIVDRFTKAI